MKILFLTSRLPFPPIGGDKLRTFNFIKYLNHNHELTLISFTENEKELLNLSENDKFYKKIFTVNLPKFLSYIKSIIGLISIIPIQVHYYKSRKMKKLVMKEIENDYDVIFCHLVRMKQYIPDYFKNKKIIDFTDAISLNYKRSRNYQFGWFSFVNYLESKRIYNYELKCIEKSDRAIFISDIDANYLKNDSNRNKISVVSNGVDYNKFKFYSGEYDPFRISFLGNMRTFPNTDAVLYFTKEIFPLLKEVDSRFKFYIIGTEPSKAVKELHNGQDIFVTGFVDSVIEYVQKSSVVVAPMRVGAGIQNKILESLAIGTPVVTTEIGAEGLDFEKLIITNSPLEFKIKILNISKNTAQRKKITVIGRKYIEEKYNWDEILQDLDSVFN